MEKFGVDVDSPEGKFAAEKKDAACPSCDGPLLKNTNVPTCPRCGTRPFEPRK